LTKQPVNKTLLQAADVGITAVVLMMVAIPEGLPLAISIAMALSINKLKNDNILIKNVESIQTCAMLHDVCCGKTGTVTTSEMHIAKFQLVDNHNVIENDRLTFANKFSKHDEISSDLRQIIIESIISNSDVRIETND
jgi:Ca2+ transporting ATPase